MPGEGRIRPVGPRLPQALAQAGHPRPELGGRPGPGESRRPTGLDPGEEGTDGGRAGLRPPPAGVQHHPSQPGLGAEDEAVALPRQGFVA